MSYLLRLQSRRHTKDDHPKIFYCVDYTNPNPIPISSVFDLFEDIELNRFYSILSRNGFLAEYFDIYYKETETVIHKSTCRIALPLKWSDLGYLLSRGAYVEFKKYDYCDALNTVFDVL